MSSILGRGFQEFNMDILLASGAGVCRHKAALLMTVLKETGFAHVSIGISPSSEKSAGHAWVEIMIEGEKYILDTSNLVSSLKEINDLEEGLGVSVKKFSGLDRSKSFVTRHYLNPENEYIYR